MATKGKSARIKGHVYERKIMHEFIKLGWKDCLTSRNVNKLLDAAGVDLANTSPFNIQCKAHECAIQYINILKSMPTKGINAIFHKRNRYEMVILSKKDFYKIIRSSK